MAVYRLGRRLTPGVVAGGLAGLLLWSSCGGGQGGAGGGGPSLLDGAAPDAGNGPTREADADGAPEDAGAPTGTAPDAPAAQDLGGEPPSPPDTSDAAGDGPPPAAGGIAVENLEAGEVVPHDLLVIQGTASGGTGATVQVALGGRTSQWPVVGGQFRALALLAPGPNEIELGAGEARLRLPVVYTPPTNPRFIRFIYIVAADGDGGFQAPAGEPQDQASALARLRVSARLMQAFLAETMRRQGFGRRTFRLARDPAHEPIIEVWKSKLTLAQARAMDGNALWSAFYQELANLPDRAASLDVAVMSMTRYLPATRTTVAHTALGGGRLGLFGSGTLYAHAAALAEIPARFVDARVVDTGSLRDDSAGRGTFWANYATGIGAMAHELGHVLSLPHPASHSGLMWRGFDNFNRTFVASEPGKGTAAGLSPVLPRNEAGLDRSNAVRLRFHRWLQPTAGAADGGPPPTITASGGNLRVASPSGVRHVQYVVAGEGAAHEELLGVPPPVLTVPLAGLRTRLGGAATVEVSTIDDTGAISSRSGISLP